MQKMCFTCNFLLSLILILKIGSFLIKDEITEMKQKLKIMDHQMDQLKEEITGKESALIREHTEFQRVEKENETLKVGLLHC